MLLAVTTSSDPNRRTDNRLDVCLKVEVTYANGQQFAMCTKNMSTTGLFVEHGEHPLPEIGDIIEIQISADLGMTDAPKVKAEVVRVVENGFGIMFLSS